MSTAERFNPFAVYAHKLNEIKQHAQQAPTPPPPHYILLDTCRVLEDLLVQASCTFGARKCLPQATVQQTLQMVTHTLRDEEILSLRELREIETWRVMRDNVTASSGRLPPRDTVASILVRVNALCQRFLADFGHSTHDDKHMERWRQHQAEGKPLRSASASCNHPHCRTFDQTFATRHSQLPLNWSVEEFVAHTAPLHNTVQLQLPTEEEEVEESEEESDYDVDPEDSDYDEEEAQERKQRKEARAQREKPPPFVPFQFCCIVCHSTLLDTEDIHRIVLNQVWSKPEIETRSLERDLSNQWQSPFSVYSVQGDERVKDQATVGVHCSQCHSYVGRYYRALDQYRLVYINKRTGENWMYYRGRGDVVALPPALVEHLVDEEDLSNVSMQDCDANGELEPTIVYQTVKQAERTPCPRFGVILGELLSTRAEQAVLGGERPGFPLTKAEIAQAEAEYEMAQSLRRTQRSALGYSDDDDDDNDGYGYDDDDDVEGAVRPLNAANTNAVDNHDRHRYGPLHKQAVSERMIIRELGRCPDPEYAVVGGGKDNTDKTSQIQAAQDIHMLLLTDKSFQCRRSIDTVSARVRQLMRTFPTATYRTRHNPVVPVYLPFFIDQPDYRHSTGTARYVYHFLTGRDETRQPQKWYTHAKFRKILKDKTLQNVVIHMKIGIESRGHRLVIVRMGNVARVLQSNARMADVDGDGYTLLQWLDSRHPWSLALSIEQLHTYMGLVTQATRGDMSAWSEVFCQDRRQADDVDNGTPGKTISFCYKTITDDFKLLPRNQTKYEGIMI